RGGRGPLPPSENQRRGGGRPSGPVLRRDDQGLRCHERGGGRHVGRNSGVLPDRALQIQGPAADRVPIGASEDHHRKSIKTCFIGRRDEKSKGAGMKEVVIVEGVRTPIGNLGGALKEITNQKMGELVVRELLKRTQVDPTRIEEVIFGCVGQYSDATNLARVITLMAGL